MKVFGPDTVPEKESEEIRNRARERLIEALQAVHLRGEVHITARELRAALVYILFGVHYCTDYQKGQVSGFLPYWDLAFDPSAPGRQGDVLRELVRFDPALEAHPQIDRYLLRSQDLTAGKQPPDMVRGCPWPLPGGGPTSNGPQITANRWPAIRRLWAWRGGPT